MNFTVYSKDGCPYCTQVKKVLDLCNFKYREYKLDAVSYTHLTLPTNA